MDTVRTIYYTETLYTEGLFTEELHSEGFKKTSSYHKPVILVRLDIGGKIGNKTTN